MYASIIMLQSTLAVDVMYSLAIATSSFLCFLRSLADLVHM